ncbi:MAG: Cellulose synthase (UDP-forming), partial [uncultured Sulfurovum sp.]
MDELYFLESKYDNRKPEAPQKVSENMQFLFQFFGVLTLMFGVWYLHYRWTGSLNPNALWFAIPLAFAETMMFIGTILVVINFWRVNDTSKKEAPKTMDDVVEEEQVPYYQDKKIKIDVYIPVFNEDPSLVRETIHAAKAVKKLPTWDVCYYLLDDSANEAMTKMTKEE